MTKAMNHWVPVPSTLKRDYEEESGSLTFHFSIAPQNIPIGVRSFLNRQSNRFVLEFRYYGHEDREQTTIEDGIVVFTGVSTGRLYAIEVPVRLAKEIMQGEHRSHDLTELLTAKISEAMSRMREDQAFTGKAVSPEYFRLTRDIVRDTGVQVFAGLTNA